ncbi:hypothetical protein DW840_13295 [Eubacterium sp. AM35-6AC]|nr:hypothetical protein DWX37_04240 [Eubacterium sp. AF19-17]RJV94508.1 hypothetical protein DW840_13295 [Eubacterium sp. AM35-6AC]
MGTYLHFSCASHEYAISQEYVYKIVASNHQTFPIPLAKRYSQQILYEDGAWYALLDIETLFFHTETKATYYMIMNNFTIALMVDTLLEPMELADTCWQPSTTLKDTWAYKKEKEIYLIEDILLQKRMSCYDSDDG